MLFSRRYSYFAFIAVKVVWFGVKGDIQLKYDLIGNLADGFEREKCETLKWRKWMCEGLCLIIFKR